MLRPRLAERIACIVAVGLAVSGCSSQTTGTKPQPPLPPKIEASSTAESTQQTPPASLNGLPQSVPIYPGELIKVTSTPAGVLDMWTVILATADSVEKVGAFYDRRLGGGGWKEPGTNGGSNKVAVGELLVNGTYRCFAASKSGTGGVGLSVLVYPANFTSPGVEYYLPPDKTAVVLVVAVRR